jgi:MarR family transcriptional regulator for hemolysin
MSTESPIVAGLLGGAERQHQTLWFLLKDVGRLYAKKFDQRVRCLGVTLAQCRVLGNLGRNEGISQAELAEAMDMEAITVARLLDRMAAAGWVERRPDPTDRRAYRLFLTEKVRPIYAEILATAEEVHGEALRGLSPHQVDSLIALLDLVQTNLSDRVPAAAAG